MKRGQFGQLPCKSDISTLSGGFWENCPNCPNCPAQGMDIGASRAARSSATGHIFLGAPVAEAASAIVIAQMLCFIGVFSLCLGAIHH